MILAYSGIQWNEVRFDSLSVLTRRKGQVNDDPKKRQ